MTSVNRVTGVPLINLITYTSDGSIVGTTTDHPTRSPFHGVWVRTGDRQFATTNLRLLFDKDGNFTGTEKVRGQITLNDTLNEYDDHSQVDFFDSAGNLTMSNPTSSHAKRMAVEALGTT